MVVLKLLYRKHFFQDIRERLLRHLIRLKLLMYALLIVSHADTLLIKSRTAETPFRFSQLECHCLYQLDLLHMVAPKCVKAGAL